MKILIENSKEKLKILEDLKVLTEKQGEIIFEEKLDKMDDLLEKKSNLMREVDKLDKEFLIKYEDLKKQFESIKAELKHIKGGKIARKGYGQQSSGSILIDEKSRRYSPTFLFLFIV